LPPKEGRDGWHTLAASLKEDLSFRFFEALTRCFLNFHAQSIGSATDCRFTDFAVPLAFLAA